MTARMTTQTLDSSRVSLPRAGLGALLAATLLAGSLIGAAASAVIGDTIARPVTGSVMVPRESTVVRDLRVAAGQGPLIGETERATVTGETTTTVVITHAPGRGPMR
jgi:hypothetical protein